VAGIVGDKAKALVEGAGAGTLIVGATKPGVGPAAGVVAETILGAEYAEAGVAVFQDLGDWLYGNEPVKPAPPHNVTAREQNHERVMSLAARVEAAGAGRLSAALLKEIGDVHTEMFLAQTQNPTLYRLEYTGYAMQTVEVLWRRLVSQAA
jgi:hypothetical protein